MTVHGFDYLKRMQLGKLISFRLQSTSLSVADFQILPANVNRVGMILCGDIFGLLAVTYSPEGVGGILTGPITIAAQGNSITLTLAEHGEIVQREWFGTVLGGPVIVNNAEMIIGAGLLDATLEEILRE